MKSFTQHKFLAFIMLTTFLMLWSCTSADPESAIRQAETDLQFGDIERAASSCDILCDSTSSSLSPTQLCRVALIYAKISEKVEQADYMAAAAKCYDRAVGLSNDSIENYIESLNIEDQSYVRVIREVSRALNTPVDMSRDFEFDECDSIMPDGGDDPATRANDFSSKSTASL